MTTVAARLQAYDDDQVHSIKQACWTLIGSGLSDFPVKDIALEVTNLTAAKTTARRANTDLPSKTTLALTEKAHSRVSSAAPRRVVAKTRLPPPWHQHTDVLNKIVNGGKCPDGIDQAALSSCIPHLKNSPEFGGLRLRFIREFFDYIAADLAGYCASTTGVVANMHTIVSRYINPWTEPFPGWGFAALYNLYKLCRNPGTSPDALAKPKVFVCHTWNEFLEQDVQALELTCPSADVVWLCALALCQHRDMAPTLGPDVLDAPCWRAMAACSRVVMVVGSGAEAFTRVWCGMEQFLATAHFCLPFSIAVADPADDNTWERVAERVEHYDIAKCNASQAKDKEAIMGFIGRDRLVIVNRVVREAALRARTTASFHALALATQPAELARVGLVSLMEFKDQTDSTLLHRLASIGKDQHLEQLLGAAVSDNLTRKLLGRRLVTINVMGETPLLSAVKGGHSHCAARLLAADAGRRSQDKADQANWTALIMAGAGGLTHCVERLLRSHADPNIRDSTGTTALLAAAFNGHTDCVDALLRGRADPEAGSNAGSTALLEASIKGRAHCVEALLRGRADPEARGRHGNTALVKAAISGQASCIDALLRGRADPEATSSQKNPALLEATLRGQAHSVEALLRGRADPEAKGHRGTTALLEATMTDCAECVQALVMGRASPDTRDHLGRTPLQIAAKRGHQQCTSILGRLRPVGQA